MRKLKKAFWLAGAGAVAIALLFASAQCERQAYEMSHDDLVAALHKRGRSRKYRIIWELIARRDKRAVKPLIAALKDPDPSVRSGAIEALAALAGKEAAEPIATALTDTNKWVRHAAARGLGKIGDRRVVAPLIGALKDPDLRVRMAAADALGALGDTRAVEPLIAMIKDKPVMPRLAAIKALGKLRDKRAVRPLIEVLGDKRADVRAGAATALGWIGPPAAAAIDPLIELLAQGIAALPMNPVYERFKPPSLVARKAVLAASARQGTHAPLPPPPNPAACATSALAAIGKAAVEPLIAALKDKRAAVRGYAAMALSGIGGERATAALARARDDREPFVRFRALEALVTLKVEEAMVASLRDGHPIIRSLAILMLAKTDNARKSDLLLGCLKDQSAEVRLTAARALGQAHDKKAVQPLAALLGDKDYMVRVAAAEALQWIRSREAVPALLAALKEPVPQGEGTATRAQVQVVQALGSLGDPAAVAPLIDVLQDEGYAPHVRSLAASSLGQIGDLRAVEPLIRMLKHEHHNLRRGAAYALGYLGDKQATKPIINAFHARMITGRDAAAVLSLIKDPRAVKVLIGLLKSKDDSARRQAISALGAIGDRAAVGPLMAKLSDRRDGIAAAQALGRLNDARAIGPLIRLLKRTKPRLSGGADRKAAVARSLANIDSPHTARLMERLLGSSNVNHRHGAVVCLGVMGKVDPVIRAMKDSERNIRLAAAQVLSRSDDPRATRALISILKHQDSGIRMYAVIGLGHAKQPSDVVGLLIGALADENASVRSYALWSLRTITKKDFGQDQEKWRRWWRESRKP